MNKQDLIRYMRALATAYALAKKDCEFGIVETDSEANTICGLWENAAMRLAQNGDIDDYAWIKSQARLVDSTQWS